MELQTANGSSLKVYGKCRLPLQLAGIAVDIDVMICDLSVLALVGPDILEDVLPCLFDMKAESARPSRPPQ